MGKVTIGRSLAAVVGIACALACSPAVAEKRVALVIGNSAYKNVARLDNPRNDARLMADTLKSLGFTLVGNGAQIDLDKPAVDRAVQAFGAQLRGADVGLFYYAGHGVQVRGANYLVPVDANPTSEADVDFQMLDTNAVLRQMEVAGTKLNLVILDACRNNPFGGRSLRAVDSGLAQMRAPEGTLISFATQPGNVAKDGSDGNSPYTKALTQTIRKPGVGIFEALNEVGLAVKRSTGGTQEPWFSSSPIDGTFFFAAPAPPPAAPAVSAPSEAERAWAATKDTTSQAILEDFIRQFGDTVYGSMARARLDELKKSQVAAVVPAPAPVQSAAPARTAPTPPPPEPGRPGLVGGLIGGLLGTSAAPQPPPAATASKAPTSSQVAVVPPPPIVPVLAVAQHAVLYEEDPNDPQGKRYVGSAIWRTEAVSPGPGLAPELAVLADIEIPELRMTVTWALRRNTDKSVPASHTIEINFKLPADFPGGEISKVTGVAMKQGEQARGTALAGLTVKVTTGFFLNGLSASDADVQRNVQLLKEREWFDIPIYYTNGHRAILAMEKGPPGDRAFAEAFAAWGK